MTKAAPETREETNADRDVQRRYDRAARFYDRRTALMERFTFGRLRKKLWSRVPTGRVLEIGVGTGANLPFYPDGAEVTAVDISERMLERANKKAHALGVDVQLVQMDAQQLEFEDESFDAVVATCVFCSVPDPVLGLTEAKRVLRPGGKLFLMEHVRAENRIAGKLMDSLNPLMVRMSGANINRRTVENVWAVGFKDMTVESHRGIVRVIEAPKDV